MTLDKATFITYEVIASCNTHLDNDNVVEAINVGSVVIKTIVRGKFIRVCIKDVLHVPNLQANLLSVSKFVSNGFESAIQPKQIFVKKQQWQSHCSYSIQRQFTQNEFYKCLRSGCG